MCKYNSDSTPQVWFVLVVLYFSLFWLWPLGKNRGYTFGLRRCAGARFSRGFSFAHHAPGVNAPLAAAPCFRAALFPTAGGTRHPLRRRGVKKNGLVFGRFLFSGHFAAGVYLGCVCVRFAIVNFCFASVSPSANFC